MAEKNSFFARLFGSKLFKLRFFRHKQPDSRSPKASAPRPRPGRSPDKPLKLSEQQRPKEASKAPPIDPYYLSLPVDHVIYELWRQCRNQSGWLPRPEITFKTEEPQLLDPDAAQAELPKLKSAITASAASRLEEIKPKALPGQDPEAPPEQAPPVDLDACAMVFISGDKQNAWLLLYPPSGKGKAPTQGSLMSALGLAGVSFGIDEGAMANILSAESPYFRL